jgi:hypothetical protein
MSPGLTVLDPILPLSSMLLALKFAKLGDPQLDEWIAQLDQRVRAARPGGPEWPAIYRDAVGIIPRILYAADEAQRRIAADQAIASSRRMVQAASMSLPSALQRTGQEYQQRLQVQETELLQKAERAIKSLPVGSTENKTTGETTFFVEPNELAAFWGWVQGADDKWRGHNQELAAMRANESIAMLIADLPPDMRFVVAPPQISREQSPIAPLKGNNMATPGMMDSVGRTWKATTTIAGSASAVLMVVSRVVQDKPAITYGLTAAGVGVLGVALVFAIATVPGQIRQQRNRIKLRADEAVQKELYDAVKARLKESGEIQLRAIRGHLTNEGERWRALVRRSDTGDTGMRAMAPQGLSPDNRAKLEGEWQHALRTRLGQLGFR